MMFPITYYIYKKSVVQTTKQQLKYLTSHILINNHNVSPYIDRLLIFKEIYMNKAISTDDGQNFISIEKGTT